MSVNFYLRRTKPILCFPEFHIGKRSYGWKPLYQANDKDMDVYSFMTQRPQVRSVDDIAAAVESGEWEIVDEYGDVYEYGDFRKRMDAMMENEGSMETHVGLATTVYTDGRGNELDRCDFI